MKCQVVKSQKVSFNWEIHPVKVKRETKKGESSALFGIDERKKEHVVFN